MPRKLKRSLPGKIRHSHEGTRAIVFKMSYNFLPPPTPVRAPVKAALRERPAQAGNAGQNAPKPRSATALAKARGPSSSAATNARQDGES
jgi:hypothetical protein